MFSYTNKEIFKKEEVFINRLNQAVAEGRITQEEADEIIGWWELKPEVIKSGMVERAQRFRASPRFHMRNGPRGGFIQDYLD